MARLSWRRKFEGARPAHISVLEKSFSGLVAGSSLLIATPAMVQQAIDRVPPGRTRSTAELRAELAAGSGADATCPLTTGIFLRIVAELALEDLAAGVPVDRVTPFWRVIDPDSILAGKLGCGRDFIRVRRAEGAALGERLSA